MAVPSLPRRNRTHSLLAVSLVLAASLAGAQTPTPQGAEFQVNSFTTSQQTFPSVAGLGSAGDFVVAWGSLNQDGDGWGVFGQRFDSAGKQDVEFQVNSFTMGHQLSLSVAGVGSAGDFVVAWHSGGLQDGSGYSVLGQRFDSAGTKQGAEFQVNSFTTGSQAFPSVAGLGSAGDFVVAWQSYGLQDGSSYGVFGQRFDSAGVKQGAEFQVNSFTANTQYRPSVAGVGSAGDFVVAWNSNTQDGDYFGVFGQRFDSAGSRQGAEFQVNSFTANQQRFSSVAGVGSAGDFVVAWYDTNQDGFGYGVFGQRFDSGGNKVGAEFQVNSFTANDQRTPSVASVGSAGDFVVAWPSNTQDGHFFAVFGQHFDSAGNKQGAEFQVNSFTTSDQYRPSVAGLGNAGDFVVAWYSSDQDGSGVGVFAQRFAGPAPTGTVTVTAPGSTKDAWGTGSIQRLRAEHDMGSSATFDIAISRDAGSTFPESIATGVASAANGTAMNFDWTVSAGTAGTPQTAAVRVSRNGAPSITDDSTTVVISGPFINVERPRNNVKTTPFQIVWLHNLGYRRPFKIELDRDGGVFNVDEVISASTLSQWAWRGEFDWTPTGSCSTQCVMRITSLDNSTFDDSVPFKIILP